MNSLHTLACLSSVTSCQVRVCVAKLSPATFKLINSKQTSNTHFKLQINVVCVLVVAGDSRGATLLGLLTLHNGLLRTLCVRRFGTLMTPWKHLLWAANRSNTHCPSTPMLYGMWDRDDEVQTGPVYKYAVLMPDQGKVFLVSIIREL